MMKSPMLLRKIFQSLKNSNCRLKNTKREVFLKEEGREGDGDEVGGAVVIGNKRKCLKIVKLLVPNWNTDVSRCPFKTPSQ